MSRPRASFQRTLDRAPCSFEGAPGALHRMRSPASDDRRWSRAIATMISARCAVFSPA